jgi:hypothetical protein
MLLSLPLTAALLGADPVSSYLVTTSRACTVELPTSGVLVYPTSAPVTAWIEGPIHRAILRPSRAGIQEIALEVIDAEGNVTRRRYLVSRTGRQRVDPGGPPPPCQVTPAPEAPPSGPSGDAPSCRFSWKSDKTSLEIGQGVGCVVYVTRGQRVGL